jgi:hypothetical protein
VFNVCNFFSEKRTCSPCTEVSEHTELTEHTGLTGHCFSQFLSPSCYRKLYRVGLPHQRGGVTISHTVFYLSHRCKTYLFHIKVVFLPSQPVWCPNTGSDTSGEWSGVRVHPKGIHPEGNPRPALIKGLRLNSICNLPLP